MSHLLQFLVKIVIATSLSATMLVTATASPFSFSVDSFTVVGNQAGVVVDDFNDENVTPYWEIYDPTVIESNNSLTFSNSGSVVQPIEFGSINLSSEWSYVGSTSHGGLQVVNGAGDFVGSTAWESNIPDINQMYGMSVWNESTGNEIGISVYNFDQTLANAFGINQGLGIFFGSFVDISSGIFFTESFSFLPSDILGDIHLALGFNDSTDMYTGGFSLDGGQTFQTPFSGVTSGSNGDRLNWSLGAESIRVIPVSEPETFWLFCISLIVFITRSNRSITSKHASYA